MFAKERQEAILKLLENQKSVTVTELSGLFSSSGETIRRDLLLLEKQGLLQRAHGGAISVNRRTGFSTIDDRISENVTQKRQLCETAAGFLREGDIISVESGSTAIEFAKVLAEMELGLTVVTNSPDVVQLLCSCPKLSLIMVGGQYLQSEHAFYGKLAIDCIQKIHVDKCFIFPTAVSIKQGAAASSLELAEISCAMLKAADQAFFLCDASKLQKTDFVKVCNFSPLDLLITDKQADKEMLAIYKENEINVIS